MANWQLGLLPNRSNHNYRSRRISCLIMQSDPFGLCLIEEVSIYSFLNIRSQFIPAIALRENVVRQAFGCISAISFLSYAEDKLHDPDSVTPRPPGQG